MFHEIIFFVFDSSSCKPAEITYRINDFGTSIHCRHATVSIRGFYSKSYPDLEPHDMHFLIDFVLDFLSVSGSNGVPLNRFRGYLQYL